MSVGLFMFIIVLVGLLIFGGVALAGYLSGNRSEMSGDQKRELASLRRLVKEINADAHRYQELEPNFTSTVIDKVSNHYQKELES